MIAEQVLMLFPKKDHPKVVKRFEQLAMKVTAGPRSFRSALGFNPLTDSAQKRSTRKRARKSSRDFFGCKPTAAQKRRNSMRRDVNGMAIFPDDGE